MILNSNNKKHDRKLTLNSAALCEIQAYNASYDLQYVIMCILNTRAFSPAWYRARAAVTARVAAARAVAARAAVATSEGGGVARAAAVRAAAARVAARAVAARAAGGARAQGM